VKTKWTKLSVLCLAVAGGLALSGSAKAAPLGTAFSYQGRLTDGATLANGIYDLRFALCDSASGGATVGTAITNAAMTISNGIFTAILDFGTNAFDGSARWIEIAVRQGPGVFTVLSPRQSVAATPYAVTAANVANPGSIFAGSFTGSFVGDGSALTNLNSTTVTAATNDLWSATTNWIGAQGYLTTNSAALSGIAVPVPFGDTNFVVDFASETMQLSVTNDVNLVQSTNLPPPGWYGECVWYILGDTTNRTLFLNTNWTAIGTLATNVPFVLVSNKLTILALSARGPDESNVCYAISRQE
jgi:hypothetical protein